MSKRLVKLKDLSLNSQKVIQQILSSDEILLRCVADEESRTKIAITKSYLLYFTFDFTATPFPIKSIRTLFVNPLNSDENALALQMDYGSEKNQMIGVFDLPEDALVMSTIINELLNLSNREIKVKDNRKRGNYLW